MLRNTKYRITKYLRSRLSQKPSIDYIHHVCWWSITKNREDKTKEHDGYQVGLRACTICNHLAIPIDIKSNLYQLVRSGMTCYRLMMLHGTGGYIVALLHLSSRHYFWIRGYIVRLDGFPTLSSPRSGPPLPLKRQHRRR